MSDYSTRNIIDYAFDADGTKFRDELYGSIHDRISAHIDAKKQEIARGLVGQNEEVKDVEESMDQPMSKTLAKGYTSSQDHGDKAPRMSDKEKAKAKAARDARDAADMRKHFAKHDAEMRKE